jgi:hypothetical protein
MDESKDNVLVNEISLGAHLDAVVSKYTSEGGVSTVLFAGKLRSEGDSNSVISVHKSIINDEINNNEGVVITGLLITQGNSILHLLEGPSYSILRILSSLSRHEHFSSENPIQSGKIIYNAEDRPRRYFHSWHSTIIAEKKVSMDELNSESSKDIVHDMVTNILENITKYVNDCYDNGEPINLNSFDSLPGKNSVLAFANSTLFFGIKDYVTIFADSYSFDPDSERIYPMARAIGGF